jgi:FdrA protein
MTTDVRLFRDTYVDSVVQLSATRAMLDLPGVDWAAAAMATPANLETLTAEGFSVEGRDSANDLFLAVRAADDEAVKAALGAGENALFASRKSAGPATARPHRTIRRAVRDQPDTNVAIISVPGDYATLEAHDALSAGLDVLLFSDNVSVDDEIALKERASGLHRLVMGPGAGTAMLGGTGLGFANVVTPGRVGIVAAAGTGAQEAMSLLDRWGVGISCVIGLGGRDLSEAVNGRMAKAAIASLRADSRTDLIFFVSKPPAPHVAREVLATAGEAPFVASLVGFADDRIAVQHLPDGDRAPRTGRLARTLEGGALQVLDALDVARPKLVSDALQERVARACRTVAVDRTLIRGLFSGGTLCYESLVILHDIVGAVYSNAPLDDSLHVPAPPGSHICLDLGEEEYTVGRPHPMIDPQARVQLLLETAKDPAVAVILLDVVLGLGSHADPASQLAPACEAAIDHGIAVVAYVLGTEGDPQNLKRQRQILEDVGCIVTETAARASLAASAIAIRDPGILVTQL